MFILTKGTKMKATPKSKVLMKRSVINKQLFDVVRITDNVGEFLEVDLSFDAAQALVESFNKPA
jgi:hypothetical protein